MSYLSISASPRLWGRVVLTRLYPCLTNSSIGSPRWCPLCAILLLFRNQRGLNRGISIGSQNNHPPGNHPIAAEATLMQTTRVVVSQVSLSLGAKAVSNSSLYNAQHYKNLSYGPQRARSVGRLGAVTLSTSRREPSNSLRLVRLVMSYQ